MKYECGDCFYNDGTDRYGVCHCAMTGEPITPMSAICRKFWLNPDFEEEEEEE